MRAAATREGRAAAGAGGGGTARALSTGAAHSRGSAVARAEAGVNDVLIPKAGDGATDDGWREATEEARWCFGGSA
eukprot:234156-Prymnesium_polylepis.1